MRILFDIVHPAHVLFFSAPIETIRGRGDEILILSRKKDITCSLLDEFGLEHTPISTSRSSVFGLMFELAQRDLGVLKAARRFKPDMMIGFGGTAISHVGKILSVPSVSFFDSENATLQNRLTWPFIDHLYVPEAYFGAVPEKRTHRLPGPPQLGYLHPDIFRPDWDRAIAAGLNPGRNNFLVRIVAWNANHDIGKRGWGPETLAHVINRLAEKGQVHISSESEMPDSLRKYKYNGTVSQLLHLLAHCRLLVGESATLASEAAILGVPAIYNGWDFPGYVKELATEGLVHNLSLSVTKGDVHSLERLIDECLNLDKRGVTARRDRFLAQRPNWADAVVRAIDNTVARQ